MKTPHILLLAAVGAFAPAMAHAHPHKAPAAHASAARPAKAPAHAAAASRSSAHASRTAASQKPASGAHAHKAAAEPVHLTRAERARQAREDAVAERTSLRKGSKPSAREVAAERRQDALDARARARMTPAQRRRADREEALAEARDREQRHPVLVATHTHVPAERPATHAAAALLSDGSRETSPLETSVDPAPTAMPDPEVARVRHDRKQHFQPASPASTAAPEPEPQAAGPAPLGGAMGTNASLRNATLTPQEPRTGVAVVEDVDSVETPDVSAAAAPVVIRRTPAPIVRQQPESVSQPKPPTPNLAPVRTSKVEPPPPPTPAPATPSVVLYNKRGQLIVPAALKGSHEILIHQNVMADADGLDRVQDDTDLEAMRTGKLLVPVPEGPGLRSDDRLPENRRFCRPWTAMFLKALSQAHYQRFGTPLQVNSAVRTVEFQQRLQRTNGNAAPAEGETASPHLTGQAIDLAKHGLSMTEIAWMRGYLLPLVQEGKIDVEEEFQQACFHISVYKKYVPAAAPKRVIAPRGAAGSSLAAATLTR